MRALGVHEDVIVLESRVWRTSATLVRRGEEAFMIDSPVFPDELELHAADGHTVDGMAVWIGWAGVLVCGDYLSPVEIPTVERSPDAYLATLARLEPLLGAARHVVPGHGGPIDAASAARVLAEDRAYLEALRGGAAELPPGRRDAQQRRLHAGNVAALGRESHP